MSVVVRSRAGWRKQMVKWQEELREEEEDGKGDDRSASGQKDWFWELNRNFHRATQVRTIFLNAAVDTMAPKDHEGATGVDLGFSSLFHLVKQQKEIGSPVPPLLDPNLPSGSEEALYMELLAAEHSDEGPDAGALEGSGDDYEG
ncbi:hypothetical protein B0H16DRAFT_1454549 [Mycena metata]|uniref:Uncharacterized protein n=1 Tax=Mycena metata TaxID=1033252 RepID=A0AAD7NJM9_9AGAR|nr:hypothetical protein B0H16DRAFT_1454549 [Mycena metata]